jgi:hypothetical protein
MPGLSFLNALFLAGMAAAILPILIHLFSRRRARRMQFSSTRFLRELNRQRIRRVRLRQLLLLALRALIIILFALAMGRPALTGNLRSGGKAPSTTCLVLDTSYSMSAGRSGEPNFAAARQRAAEVIDLLGDNDEAYLITVSDQAESFTPYPVQDLGLIREHLIDLGPTARAGEMRDGLELAARLLRASRNLNREMYVISDLQRSAWPSAGDSAGVGLESLPRDAAVCVLGLGEERIENLAIDDVRVERGRAGGRGTTLDVRLSNHTDRRQSGVPVTAYVGETRIGEVFADMEAGASARVRIDIGEGPWADAWGRVRIPEDALAIDDVRHFLLGAERRARVAVVADRSGGAGGRSDLAAEFVRLALEPERGAGPYEVRVIIAPDLGGSQLTDFSVVVLAGLARSERDGVERLKTFVRDGGGLLIFPGEKSDLRFYNDRLLAPFLSVKLAGVVDASRTGASGGSFQLTPTVTGHAVFLGFNAGLGERLTHARFQKVVKVVPGGARVLAEFSPDLPAMIEGEGVLFFASSVDRAWNDLPTSGAFVPMLHQAVAHLVRSGAESGQTRAGTRIERLVPAPAVPTHYRAIAADGSPVAVEAVERGAALLLRTPPVERPGIYRLVDEAGNEVALAAVNPDTRESDLALAEIDAIARLFSERPFAYLRGDQEATASVRTIRQGRELWRAILLLALALLVVEVLLSRGKGAFTPAGT